MSGLTWTRWFFADWMSDPGVRLSSYAARGLWKDMLCIAAESGGFVCVKGKPLDAAGIARATGGTTAEVEALLEELDRNGVFSRDRRGAIYSRRMVKDAKRAAVSVRNGKKGGNPSLRKTSVSGDRDNPPLECGSGNGSLSSKPLKEKEAKTETLFGALWPKDYREQFWRQYPKRVKKKAAMAALDRVRASGLVAWPDLLAGAMRYAAEVAEVGTEWRYIKHPATWINDECWTDEPMVRTEGGTDGGRRNGLVQAGGRLLDRLVQPRGAGPADSRGGTEGGVRDRAGDGDVRMLPKR